MFSPVDYWSSWKIRRVGGDWWMKISESEIESDWSLPFMSRSTVGRRILNSETTPPRFPVLGIVFLAGVFVEN